MDFDELTQSLLKKMNTSEVTNDNLISFVTERLKKGKNIKDVFHENQELVGYFRLGGKGKGEYGKFWNYIRKELRKFNKSPEAKKRLMQKAKEKGAKEPIIIKIMTEK